MHDPVDIRRRIASLVARVDRRDDYGELLASGHVVRRVEKIEDVGAWRAEIRSQARADKIKVRTGENDGCVWALVVRAPRDGWTNEERQYSDLLSRVVPLAVGLGHEPSVGLRDGGEVICACDRCEALGYGDVADDLGGGRLFEDECPHEDPPKVTGLAFMPTDWSDG